MTFDEWAAKHGVYLNDKDNAAKAARAMARRAWDASQIAERERWATAARLAVQATPEQLPLALDALRDVLDA